VCWRQAGAPRRVHEITKTAIQRAIQEPRELPTTWSTRSRRGALITWSFQTVAAARKKRRRSRRARAAGAAPDCRARKEIERFKAREH
jgi:hypothetical protein